MNLPLFTVQSLRNWSPDFFRCFAHGKNNDSEKVATGQEGPKIRCWGFEKNLVHLIHIFNT